MSLAHDWPVPLTFAVVGLIVGSVVLIALRRAGVLERWTAVVVLCAAFSPMAIGLVGTVDAWQPGQPHDGGGVGTTLCFALGVAGCLAALVGTVGCLGAIRKSIGWALVGGGACLTLLPISVLALLAAGQMLAGASL